MTPAFSGLYVGQLVEGGGEVRLRFAEGKVEWIEPGKRAWHARITNQHAYVIAGNKVTIARDGSGPVVYILNDARKGLTLESGEGKTVPKELKLAQ